MPTIAEVRAQYPQYSDMSDADLAGALHKKFYSDMPEGEFNKRVGLNAPDQYQQAAIDERNQMDAQGIDTGAGYTRRLAHGVTLGADNTIMAGLMTPLEMIRRGTFSPSEGYNYAKAREDLIMDDSRKQTGKLGTALEIAGGAGTGLGLARGGLTFARGMAPEAGLLARSAASAGDAAAVGGFSGAMEGNGLSERGANALKGLAVGGVLGGLTPGVLSVLGAAASPITSNIRARVNPNGYAESQIARAVSESGMTPAQVTRELEAAAREGQGMYTLADALGNPGQRMLSTVTRAPGEGRTNAVNFLEGRQAGQGRRVASTLAEGFDSPQTAAQTEARLTAARDAAADAEYGAARAGAGRVDVVPAINNIDRTIGTGPGQALTASNDSIEGVLRPYRERLARVNPDDFEAVQRIREDMADAAHNARQNGYGNRARLIRGAVDQLDAGMENASSGYRAANANFAQASRDIDAVGQGRDAALRGRVEDTIPRYAALSPRGQTAFRAGYADPLIAQTQGAAFGVNKARPLINDAFQAEANAMAPGNGLMQRRLGREQRMFETRNTARGGSTTVENFADDAAMAVDPSLIGNVLSGNWQGAMRSAISAGSNALTGNTPQVRQIVGDILTRNGVQARSLERMITETINRIRFVQGVARNVGRGAAGGLAVAGPGQNRR